MAATADASGQDAHRRARSPELDGGWEGFSPPIVREQAARRLRVIAHPVRLQLLELLSHRRGGATVGELARHAGISLEAASKHLRALAREGVVRRSQYGTSAYYRLADVDYARVGAVTYRAVIGEFRRKLELLRRRSDPPAA